MMVWRIALIVASSLAAAEGVEMGCEASSIAVTKQLGVSIHKDAPYTFTANISNYGSSDFVEILINSASKDRSILSMLVYVEMAGERVGAFMPTAGLKTKQCDLNNPKGTVVGADTTPKPLPIRLLWKAPLSCAGTATVVGVALDSLSKDKSSPSYGWSIIGKHKLPPNKDACGSNKPLPPWPSATRREVADEEATKEESSTALIIGLGVGLALGLIAGAALMVMKFTPSLFSGSKPSPAERTADSDFMPTDEQLSEFAKNRMQIPEGANDSTAAVYLGTTHLGTMCLPDEPPPPPQARPNQKSSGKASLASPSRSPLPSRSTSPPPPGRAVDSTAVDSSGQGNAEINEVKIQMTTGASSRSPAEL